MVLYINEIVSVFVLSLPFFIVVRIIFDFVRDILFNSR